MKMYMNVIHSQILKSTLFIIIISSWFSCSNDQQVKEHEQEIYEFVLTHIISDLPPQNESIIFEAIAFNKYFINKIENNPFIDKSTKPYIFSLSKYEDIIRSIQIRTGMNYQWEINNELDNSLLNLDLLERSEILNNKKISIVGCSPIYPYSGEENGFIVLGTFICGKLCGKSYSFIFKIADNKLELVKVNESVS
jgi:hypothetical protein